MDVTVRVPAIEKLLDLTASGIGAIAGPMLATWRAGREAEARRIAARGDADVLAILAEGQAGALPVIAEAQENARRQLTAPGVTVEGEVAMADGVEQRVRFQEKKRQRNITAIVSQAAAELNEDDVEDREPDHDWAARFFNEAQDVSSEEMQLLWAKVLAGEVERPGSTSVRALGILRNIDQPTAALFARFCGACVFLIPGAGYVFDARVLSLGKNAGDNALSEYGFSFNDINVLNEHGLVISDYNSWRDYSISVLNAESGKALLPFRYGGKFWTLNRLPGSKLRGELRLHGVALSGTGRELASIVEAEPMEEYTQALNAFLRSQSLQLVETDFVPPPLTES